MQQLDYFIAQNVYFLGQGIKLIDEMSDEVYTSNGHAYFSSGIGKHVRHVLDLYRCLMNAEEDSVDYDTRQRNPRVEQERHYAIQETKDIISGLQAIGDRFKNQSLHVIKVNSNEGENLDGISTWSTSSVIRELQYIVSHTIHHFAIIGMIYRILGGSPPDDFGVAPSTLLYEESLKGS